MKKLNYDFLDGAREMPPLPHSVPNRKFDIMDSRVCDWLVNDPEIRQKIFNMAVNKKVIVYDPETAMWKGADYKR